MFSLNSAVFSENSVPCARCKVMLHPLNNCRRVAEGVICMRCHENPEPICLHSAPQPDDPEIN